METITSIKNIHNSRVYDANGNDCGIVSSLLMDAEDSQVLFAVIRLGSAVESKGTTAIPWNSLKFNPNTGNLNLNINQDILYSAPQISPSDFKHSNKNAYLDLLKYYGYSPTKLDPDAPTAQDVRGSYHEKNEGEEYSGNPIRNDKSNMGEELDFDKIKGTDRKEL